MRDKVVRKELVVNYISTVDHVASVFTKDLSFAHFNVLTSKLMVRCHPISFRGCDSQNISACLC